MREIKFRAWDSKAGQMYDSEYVDTYTLRALRDERYSLLQYTGLKDKNGVEIYEGDIVNNGAKGQNFHIRWSESRGCWWVGTTHLNLYDGEPDKRYEVIGNIYENGDLLK